MPSTPFRGVRNSWLKVASCSGVTPGRPSLDRGSLMATETNRRRLTGGQAGRVLEARLGRRRAAVRQGFGDVDALDAVHAFQVGDGARQAQDAGPAPGADPAGL